MTPRPTRRQPHWAPLRVAPQNVEPRGSPFRLLWLLASDFSDCLWQCAALGSRVQIFLRRPSTPVCVSSSLPMCPAIILYSPPHAPPRPQPQAAPHAPPRPQPQAASAMLAVPGVHPCAEIRRWRRRVAAAGCGGGGCGGCSGCAFPPAPANSEARNEKVKGRRKERRWCRDRETEPGLCS